ncbi:hypothetical protein [Haladaptatus sp. NG-SE-30]
MSALLAPSRIDVTLLLLAYLVVAQAQHLPDGAALVGYVTGFLLIVLIPLLALDETRTSTTSKTK